MGLTQGLFDDAPRVVLDSCTLKALFTPVRHTLLESGDKKTLYLDLMVEAARQGFIQLGVPASVIYETSGHNPLTGKMIDKMFTDPKRDIIYNEGQISHAFGKDLLAGKIPNAQLMTSEEGIDLLTQLEELSARGRRTGSFIEFNEVRKSRDVDDLTRKAARSQVGPGGSTLITEDHQSRDLMFFEDAQGARLACGNLMVLVNALYNAGAFPKMGLKEEVTPTAVHANFRDYTSQLNEKKSASMKKPEQHVKNAYSQPVVGSSVESLNDMLEEWILRRSTRISNEAQAELDAQKPWHHQGNPTMALAEPEAPDKSERKRNRSRKSTEELRGGLGGRDTGEGWIPG